MGTLFLSHVIIFLYIIPLVAEDKVFIVCINLVLPMGWVESPKFFCALLEMLTGVFNYIIYMLIILPRNRAISEIPNTRSGMSHILYSLTNIYFYLDYFIILV